MGIKPYTEKIKEVHGRKLAKSFPKYDPKIILEYVETDPMVKVRGWSLYVLSTSTRCLESLICDDLFADIFSYSRLEKDHGIMALLEYWATLLLLLCIFVDDYSHESTKCCLDSHQISSFTLDTHLSWISTESYPLNSYHCEARVIGIGRRLCEPTCLSNESKPFLNRLPIGCDWPCERVSGVFHPS